MTSSGNGGDEAEVGKTLKEGERILGPTRRPDGTLRKPIRIRAGYTPQDEVAIYQSKGSLWRKEMSTLQEVPPGYDPVEPPKPKSKSAKRNERKKEKRQQFAEVNEKDSNSAKSKLKIQRMTNRVNWEAMLQKSLGASRAADWGLTPRQGLGGIRRVLSGIRRGLSRKKAEEVKDRLAPRRGLIGARWRF